MQIIAQSDSRAGHLRFCFFANGMTGRATAAWFLLPESCKPKNGS